MAAAEKATRDTKRRIFEAALTLFTEKGYERTTMDDIIAAADVSKGSIYWHFKSKMELFNELFEFWFESVLADLTAIMRSDKPPLERFRSLIEMSLVQWIDGQLEQVLAFMEFVNMALKDEDFKRRMVRLYKTSSEGLAEVIQAGIESGEFGVSDARKCADSIISYLDGLMLRSLVDPAFRTQENLDFIVLFIMRSLEYRGLQG